MLQQLPPTIWNYYFGTTSVVDSHVEEVSGGLSGGRVWKCVDQAGQAWAVRQWPHGYDAGRARALHLLQRHLAAMMPMVPTPRASARNDSVVALGSRIWECVDWRDGAPFDTSAGAESKQQRLRAFGELLADWHDFASTTPFSPDQWTTWGDQSSCETMLTQQTCCPPGWYRRRQRWDDAKQRLAGSSEPNQLDPLASLARRSRQRLLDAARVMDHWLEKARDPSSLVLALRDIHCDHVLFVGDKVTGLIDFGAVAIDTPAVDLARYLGSLFPWQFDQWSPALEAYRARRRLARRLPTDQQVWAFHLLGLVLSVYYWWRQHHDGLGPSLSLRAIDRWRTLIEQLEHPNTQAQLKNTRVD